MYKKMLQRLNYGKKKDVTDAMMYKKNVYVYRSLWHQTKRQDEDKAQWRYTG